MANEEHLTLLKQGADAWNKWRDDQEDVIPDLNSAILRNVDLSGFNLRYANIAIADLTRSSLVQPDYARHASCGELEFPRLSRLAEATNGIGGRVAAYDAGT